MNALATPLFQYAVFYDSDLEILPGPDMTIRGRVHTNRDMYLGSNATLTFNTNYLRSAGNMYRNRKDDPTSSPGSVQIRNWVANPFNVAEPSLYTRMNSQSQMLAGGVTTTSGLAWKIPGRAGDSPILGAGLYVDGEIGAAGSTGRGESNLYNLSSFLIVEEMRRGAHPKDAAMTALKRVAKNTIEKRLLNAKGQPNFGLNFYCLNAKGEFAGVSMYQATYAVCTENGPQTLQCDTLFEGRPTD
jgi:N4-(beta-N-acetylglucosaminyl)-L-asparaginase